MKAITALSDITYSCTLTSHLASCLNCSSTFTCERQNESWSSTVSLGDVVLTESESSGVSLPTRCFTYCSQSCAKTRPLPRVPPGFLASFGHMLHNCLRRYGCNFPGSRGQIHILIALLFLIKSAVSGRGSLRGQLWCSSVFGFLSSPKRAFQRGGSHSGFKTLPPVKGRHDKAQQPNL